MSYMNSLVSMLALALGGLVAGCSSSTPSLQSGASNQPAVVGPQTFKVFAGAQTGNQAYQALGFYPKAITIDAGDTIVWTANPAEPHTISFPIPGTTPVPPTDASAQQPAGGTTFDGTAYDSSGFIGGGATYALTFTQPGTYTYYSLPQLPVVSGTVVVQAKGSAYPLTQGALAADATSAIDADFANAEHSVASVPFTPGSNMIAAGVSPATAGGASSTVMRFLDGPTETDDLHTTIPVGTTLTFENRSNNVPHTVTIPAAGAAPPAGPPFQTAAGGTTYDGTALVNSGVIPPGGTFSVTFTAAGTFPYFCLFHDAAEGMVGMITVTP